MNLELRPACATILLACLSAAATAAGNTPINSESRAARAVLTAFIMRIEMREMVDPFNYETRNIIDRALHQLNATTTYASLLGSPGGVVVNCGLSGNFRARMANSLPRVVKFDWNNCVSDFFGYTRTLNGPGEVTLIGNSLAPSVVASIRLGDRQRDLVRVSVPPSGLPPGFPGPDIETRNLRVTGILPLTRDDENSYFPGRFTYEVAGFFRYVQNLPDWSTGSPSVEFYPHTHTLSTDGALITGELSSDTYSWLEDYRVVGGEFAERYDVPATPTYPIPHTVNTHFRGTDLRVQVGHNAAIGRDIAIDGKLESNFAQAWGYGCTSPETFTYLTRAMITTAPDSYGGDFFDSGELLINGSTNARFSVTGTQPYVDLVMHVAVDARGVGTFNYDVPTYMFNDMAGAASCTP